MDKNIKNMLGKIISLLPALFWLVITATPFLFMVFSSLKKQFELLNNGVFAVPNSVYVKNYIEVLSGNFSSYFFNSVVVVGISLALLLFISSCAAYPLSKFRFALCKPIFGLIVAAMSIPIHVTLIPVFIMTTKVNLYDTIWALVGPYIAFGLPISVFILTTFMASISKEMEEAAEIDGCSKYRIFFTIILPLSKSGLATLAIYNAVAMWNEFSFALVLTQSQTKRTLPLAIWEYQGQHSNDTPLIMTVLVLSALPMIAAFIVGQEKLIKGMMAGAVKE